MVRRRKNPGIAGSAGEPGCKLKYYKYRTFMINLSQPYQDTYCLIELILKFKG